MDDSIVLRLTPQRMDYIANVLSQRPYAEVAQLLAEISAQVQAQRQAPQPIPMPHGNGATEASP